jgi:hypothetical protein
MGEIEIKGSAKGSKIYRKMGNSQNHIVMTSLLEEREQLHRILADKNQDPLQLEDRIITWANDMLTAASENEPGQVQLIPLPDRTGEQVKDPPADTRGEHQSLGGGSSRIVQNGPHQKLS